MKRKRIFQTILRYLIIAGIVLTNSVAFSAITDETVPSQSEETGPATTAVKLQSFDYDGQSIYSYYKKMSDSYLASTSTERSLDEYYARRQYPGSPPIIPHEVNDGFTEETNCLSCHLRGGYVEKMGRHAPLTPHPDQTSCRQCHVTKVETKLFVDIDWLSVAPPRLGHSALPGSPPAIPHDLQMRGNCPSCHVGAGAVTAIRVAHATRGNCRQCHVAGTGKKVFKRTQ